jgi:hypothetical protein
MQVMKSHLVCADVCTVMEQPPRTPTTQSEPKRETDHIAVSAEQLMELIRSGHGDDVDKLVRQTLHDRHAA